MPRKATCWSTTSCKHRHLWEEVGGVFIHHKSAAESIAALSAYFPIEAPADAAGG